MTLQNVIIYAKDMAPMARFYGELLGLTPAGTPTETWIEFSAGPCRISLHAIPSHIAAGIHIANPPEAREETPIKLCLPVADIDHARTKAAELGGKIGPKGNEWEARGFRACDGYDPEGNVFQVRESAA